MKKRDYELDAIRSLCFVWIVAVWHMNSYLMPSLHYSGYVLDIFHNITYAALGMFTLLSGALLSKYRFFKLSDVIYFYKKRVSRFFILLLLSAVTYRLVGWIDTKQVIQVIIGLNLFVGPSAPTLWFFSMMVFFYVITPLLRGVFDTKKPNTISVCIAGVVFILLSLSVYLFDADKRLLYYFPMYIIGLFLGRKSLVTIIHSKWVLFFILLVVLIFIGGMHPIIAEIAGGVLFLLGGRLAIPPINNLWRTISISSMVAYLFHRQFFSAIMRLYENKGVDYIPLFSAIIAFFVLVFISYYAQKLFDYLKAHN